MNTSKLKRKVKEVLPVGASVMILDALAGRLPLQRAFSRPLRRTIARLEHGEDATVAGGALRPRVATVAERFDAWEERDAALLRARGALDAAGIEYALLPGRYGTRTVVVRAPDKVRAILALEAHRPGEGAWHLAPARRPRSAMRLGGIAASRLHRAAVERYAEFVLFDHRIAPSGKVFGDVGCGVEISFWEELHDDALPRPDGCEHEPGTILAPSGNGIAAYLSPAAWSRAMASPDRWPESASLPHIYRITEPIDAVYTWVDGDDPAWRRRKNTALGSTDADALNETAANPSRYASRDELRYSLRSLEMYANWVRNVYIVADDQVPPWLDTTNPRVRVVDHREIFSDPGVLPVFNSHAIESQLHHIDGLSRQFLYLNDDVLFGDLVQPADFFLSSTLSRYFPSSACLDIDPPSSRDIPVLSAAKNARRLIADEFGVTITNKFKHTPMPLQRDVLDEMEARFPELFERVAASKFRHPADYSIASGLYHYYAFATGRAVPGSIAYGYQDISREDLPFFLKRLEIGHPYRVFCLNDTDSTEEQIAALTPSITATMQACYPFPSSFEKSPHG